MQVDIEHAINDLTIGPGYARLEGFYSPEQTAEAIRNGWFYTGINDFDKEFHTESAIVHTSKTPIFGDSIWVDAWPVASDPPARNLYQGGNTASMQRLTIARHGSSSAKAAPRSVPSGAPLPGVITVEFADGHAEFVKLESLWSLIWHKSYVPPSKRPN